MKTLKSAIAVRILDYLGVVSGETNDIRNELFLTKHKGNDIYSGRIDYSEKESLFFLYAETKENEKYMISFSENDKGKKGEFILCIVSNDVEEESPDLNRLILGTANKNFREVSFLEAGKFLNTFEIIRNHIPNWTPNKPSENDIEYLLGFIKAIDIN